jgi:hypothetical protein
VTVYFIQSGKVGPIKIGRTEGNVGSRLANLQTGSPEPLTLLAVVPGGPAVERSIHERFAKLRLRGEWFRREPDLSLFIEGIIAATGAPDSSPDEAHAAAARIDPAQVEMTAGFLLAFPVAVKSRELIDERCLAEEQCLALIDKMMELRELQDPLVRLGAFLAMDRANAWPAEELAQEIINHYAMQRAEARTAEDAMDGADPSPTSIDVWDPIKDLPDAPPGSERSPITSPYLFVELPQ